MAPPATTRPTNARSLPRKPARGPGTTNLKNNRIGARLLQFADRWSFLSPSLATALRRGYHWRWEADPPQLKLPRLRQQPAEVQEQVSVLLSQGAIYEVPLQPCLLSNIFVVPKFPVGSRLILDVSYLNDFIVIPSFGMTNHKTLASLLSRDGISVSVSIGIFFGYRYRYQNF